VREQIALIVSGRATAGEFGHAFAYIDDATRAVLQVLHDQSLAHAPLTMFALAALVLSLFMTRT
jgi:hypothetical protein